MRVPTQRGVARIIIVYTVITESVCVKKNNPRQQKKQNQIVHMLVSSSHINLYTVTGLIFHSLFASI